MEIIAKIIEFCENITVKRIIIIFIIACLIVLCFPLIDYYFYYNIRTNSRIEVLDKITKLDIDKIKQNSILLEEYKDILKEIQEHRGFSLNVSGVFSTTESASTNLYKFLSGGFWGWLLILLSPFIYKKKIKVMLIAILIFGLIGAFLGWVSLLLPTFNNPILNFVGFPIFQLIIGVIIGLLVTKNGKKK